MEKKTALQQAIEYCLTLTPICHQDMSMYNYIIAKLNELLPTERQQIEEAYRSGAANMGDLMSVPHHKNLTPQNYYEQTYGK